VLENLKKIKRRSAVKITLIQMPVVLGKPEENFRAVKERIERASRTNPDVIVLPEMWNTGYSLANIREIADVGGARVREEIAPLARKCDINLVAGSVANLEESGVYNSMYVFDRRGEELARYDKIHLFQLMEEHLYLKGGSKTATFVFDGHLCGGVICYDIRFPELIRTLALRNIKVLFVCAEWPHPRLEHWRNLLISRAIENQMFVVACNRMGKDGNTAFFGHSMIIDPWGEIVGELGEEEGFLSAEIDPCRAEEIRKKIPVFTDRRPELYECCSRN